MRILSLLVFSCLMTSPGCAQSSRNPAEAKLLSEGAVLDYAGTWTMTSRVLTDGAPIPNRNWTISCPIRLRFVTLDGTDPDRVDVLLLYSAEKGTSRKADGEGTFPACRGIARVSLNRSHQASHVDSDPDSGHFAFSQEMLAELLPWPSASISLEPGATWTDDRVFKDYDTFPGPRVWTTVRRDNLLRVEMASPRQVCAPHSGRHERHETTLESYSKVFHLDLRSRIPRRFERVRVTTMKESDSVITYDLRIALDRTGVGTADTAVLRSGCEAAKKALDAVVGIDGVDERALEDVVKLHSSHLSKIPDPHIRDHALEDLRRAADRKRDSWEYQEAKNEVESRLLNKAAPEVGGKDFGGHDVGLSKLKGSVVILSFWHSTCTPCRAEVPHLNRALERYRDRGLVVLALNKEDTPNEREAVKSFKFAYPVILGAQDAFKAYGTTGIPCLVFIDRKGIVRAREVGFGKDVPERIEATVKELIEEPGVAPK